MSSLLKFTHATLGAAADGRSAIFATIGNVTCSIVGEAGSAREFRLVAKPAGPEEDATSALTLGVLGTGATAVLATDAIGSYVVELWVNIGAGLAKADAKIVAVEDEHGIVRLPDKAVRSDITEAGTAAATFDGSGRGLLFIHDRNWAKVRAGLGPGFLIVDELDDLPALTDEIGLMAWVRDLHRWATADAPFWWMEEFEEP